MSSPKQTTAKIRSIADPPHLETDLESVPRPADGAVRATAIGGGVLRSHRQCQFQALASWRRPNRREWCPFSPPLSAYGVSDDPWSVLD